MESNMQTFKVTIERIGSANLVELVEAESITRAVERAETLRRVVSVAEVK